MTQWDEEAGVRLITGGWLDSVVRGSLLIEDGGFFMEGNKPQMHLPSDGRESRGPVWCLRCCLHIRACCTMEDQTWPVCGKEWGGGGVRYGKEKLPYVDPALPRRQDARQCNNSRTYLGLSCQASLSESPQLLRRFRSMKCCCNQLDTFCNSTQEGKPRVCRAVA